MPWQEVSVMEERLRFIAPFAGRRRHELGLS